MNHSTLQRRGFTFLEFVIVLGTLMLLAAILFPIFGRPRDTGSRRAICQSNLKQIGLGFKQYIQDYNEKYPPVTLSSQASPTPSNHSSFGWADSLQPYLKSTQIFQCDKEPNAPDSDPTQSGYTDYWFNGRMAGIWEAQLEHQALTVINSDGESSDARYYLRSFPQKWFGDTNSPIYRHFEGAHFAFADGHAKWLRADRWKNGVDLGKNSWTFRLKPKN